MNRHTWTAAALGGILLLAGCGDTSPSAEPDATTTGDAATDTPTDGGGTTQDTSDATVVGSASSDLGTILVDGDGRTLYLFDNDSEGTSTCTDDCAQTWPPLLGEAEASGDVDASLLGTTERADGSTQVTYSGWPLYLYAADAEPGDVNGQAVGDVWWVVAPDGSRITATATEAEAPAYEEGPY